MVSIASSSSSSNSSYYTPAAKKQGSHSSSSDAATSVFNKAATKTSPLQVCKKIGACIINPDNTSFINSVLGEARAVYGLVKTFFSNMIKFSRIFNATEFSKTLSLPFDVYNLLIGAFDFIVEKGDARLDAFLGILGSVSEIGDAVSSLAAMLVELGALGASTMSWAVPLNLASCVLSAVFIVMNIRSLYISTQVVKKLNKNLTKIATPDYRKAYTTLKKHSYELESHCGVDVKKVQTKIRKLYKKKHAEGTPKSKKEFNANMDKVFKSLKVRIHHKQFSLALGMVITKVGMLATLLFALSPFFSPLAVGGFVALAVLFSLSLFKMGFDFYANMRLRITINAIPDAIPKGVATA